MSSKRNNTNATNNTAKRIKGKALEAHRQMLFERSSIGILLRERERAQKALQAKLASMSEEERLSEMDKALNALPLNETDDINAESVQQMGERIAVRSLKTTYQASGNPFILRLYCGLIVDIMYNIKNAKAIVSDGYDIVQTAILFLLSHKGKKLTDKIDDSENAISILRACFREIGRYIDGERQKEYKKVYIEDVENGLVYEIPFKWDMPTLTDYISVKNTIEKLGLSRMEKRIISLRLQGKSNTEIADSLSITESAVKVYRNRIRAKVAKTFDVTEKTAEKAEAIRTKETAKRKAETAKRNENQTATKSNAFEGKTHAEKIATLKRLYKKAKASGNAEKAEAIKRYAVKLEKQHQRQKLTAEAQAKIEKRILKLISKADAPQVAKN